MGDVDFAHPSGRRQPVILVDEAPPTSPITLRVSDVVAYEGCKRKWWWEHNYGDGLFHDYFFIGTGVHVGLAAYYANGRVWDYADHAIYEWAIEERRAFEGKYRQQWWEVDGDTLIETVRAMMRHYTLYDAENFLDGDVQEDEQGSIIERRVTVPIRDEHGKVVEDANGVPVFLTGKVDLVLGRPGGLYIVDHKTFGERTLADNPVAGLDVDDQVTAYAYLTWREWGFVPQGVIYNVLVKAVPRAPKLIRNDTALSVDRSAPTTAPLVREAIKAHGFTIEPYLDYLAYLEANAGARFFQRWTSPRSEAELHAFEARLAVKARDIVRLVETPHVYAYPSGSSYRCGRCPFLGPCKAADDGGDAQAILDNFQEKTRWAIDE
jgi:hypothetical protein